MTLRSLALLFIAGALGTAVAPTVSTMIAMRFVLGSPSAAVPPPCRCLSPRLPDQSAARRW